MIRMIQSTSASHAKAYFSDALLKSDYYIDDQELQGKFNGKLAERLQLNKTADKEDFFALCENINPRTGQRLTPRKRDERTVGYDINFHCPKSVSIVHALSGDDHILQAFEQSVKDTMSDIETDSKTRIRKKGRQEDRATGELLWADFTHQTARPVDDHVPDPHLHSHCFVFNATWDDTEKEIKAGQFREVKRDMPYYQARFHKRLSDNLITLGYQIDLTDKSFELKGVPKQAIDLFSKRTSEIGQVAKEKGITDARELDSLGARTRARKQKSHSMAALKEEWRNQINALAETITKEEGTRSIRYAPDRTPEKPDPVACLDHAILHSFERASVMNDRRLLGTAYRYAMGNTGTTVEAINQAYLSDNRLIHITEGNRQLCTTRAVLAEEKRMVDLARAGLNAMMPMYERAPELKVTEQQADAVAHILTTHNRVSIIRGAAGTGKTTLMREAVDHIETTGRKVLVVAPTAQASRGVLKDEGFAQAETVARLLIDKKLQDALHGQVLWVDEAGLLGTKDMTDLLDLVARKNARLILGGDTRQHASVVRGDALRILNTVGGIETAEVSKIYRQKNEQYKAAVENLSKGAVRPAFDILDTMGAIKTIDPLKPNDALVDDFMQAVKKGKTALVISPTHKQGEEVTQEIRKRMRKDGMIGKKEIRATKLSSLNLTAAEKADWRNYQPGQVIQFSQNLPGITRGSSWTVKAIQEKDVTIENDAQQVTTLPRHKADQFDVLKQGEIGLSKGDKVHITKNSFDGLNRRMNNGLALDIVKVTAKGQIVLQNTASKALYKLDKTFGHLRHAHCITSHASQGKTVDEIFIAQPSATFPATDARQFYVSISRGRDKAHLYTDDKVALLEHASDLGDRQSALELVNKKDVHTDHMEHLDRQDYGDRRQHDRQKEINTIGITPKDIDYEPEL